MSWFFKKIFRRKGSIFPCDSTGECPYEYDKNPDQDIEGMPFVEKDPRSCPTYGHICPKFMEEFGLTVEDLRIRAMIHCGAVMERLIEDGEKDAEAPESRMMMDAYKQAVREYPINQYPEYY